jgi:Cft2 family RNA processing exonuclease
MDLEPEIYSTSITARLSGLLARDTLKISEKRGHNIPYYNEERQDFERRAMPVNYMEEFETSGFNVCFYDAGHIPGSSSVYLEKDRQRLYYISEIYDDAKSKIHLTGYQAEDTNGREAVESGYIEDRNRTIHLKCRLELYDFSAHGDNTQGFADWIKEEIGVESTAPVNGETIYI